ncbi:hypothetical protein [Roseivivax marinus]|uniref:hypothetical protein n=1 Tax=Roseivivax marinus TaxID=1379903 RepID=UPI00273D08C0|nr:hypothetical protein [Roseivivax marinus]
MNRRDLILTAAAGVSLPAVSTAAQPARQIDPHAAWLAEWIATRDAINAHPTGTGPHFEAITDRNFELDTLLSETRATTVEGAAAQVQWLIIEDDWMCDYHSTLAQNLLKTLEGMA